MSAGPRLLVLDGYPREDRAELVAVGGTEAGELYRRMLSALAPDAVIDVVYPAEGSLALPAGVALASYDGAAWTGSSLTVYHADHDRRVARQLEVARALLAAGVPCFGSCWAAQVAAVVAGGAVEANPRGHEYGVTREITITPAGADHPMLRGKARAFRGFACHRDHVTALGSAALLATNDYAPVQAIACEIDGTAFWATQYHPEYDVVEVGRLGALRRLGLVDSGAFASLAAVDRYLAHLGALGETPADVELAASIGADETVLDPASRWLEVSNWLEVQVLGRR